MAAQPQRNPSAADVDAIHAAVQDRYAAAARAVIEVGDGARPTSDHGRLGLAVLECCRPDGTIAFGAQRYARDEVATLPDAAVLASLGCGNPTAVAELRPGETVLDLGSGGGIDVLLSARRVGPAGRAIGVDMTDEMLELAEQNAADAGLANVEFRKGSIEALPVADASVDVVISNCVINLAADKGAVLAEVARVLRDGGRLGVSDVVAEDRLSPAERAARGSFAGCIAGALSFDEYRRGLLAAGLVDVVIEPTHAVADGLHAAIIRARKPAGWTPPDPVVLGSLLPAATPPTTVESGCGCRGGGCC